MKINQLMSFESAKNWIDVSIAVKEGMTQEPGNPPFRINKFEGPDLGIDYDVAEIRMSTHAATHVAAPLFAFETGHDVSEIPLDVLIGPVKIFSILDDEQISLHEIKEFPLEENDRVFFKTKNSESEWWNMEYFDKYIFLASDAAAFLQSKKIRCVGIDYLSVSGKINGDKVHQLLLGNGICIIEGLNLKDIEPGTYEMVCLPLKIKGSGSAPARVIIRRMS